MPSSLLRLNGIMGVLVVYRSTINNLVLNEGLLSIDNCSNNHGCYDITNLWIPSSLKTISGIKFCPRINGVKNLIFSNHNVEEYREALMCILKLCFEFRTLEVSDNDLDSEQYFNLSGSSSLMDMQYSLVPLVNSLKFFNYGGSGLTISLDKSLLQNRFCVRKDNRKLDGVMTHNELDSLVTYIKNLVEKEYERQEKYEEGKNL